MQPLTDSFTGNYISEDFDCIYLFIIKIYFPNMLHQVTSFKYALIITNMRDYLFLFG